MNLLSTVILAVSVEIAKIFCCVEICVEILTLFSFDNELVLFVGGCGFVVFVVATTGLPDRVCGELGFLTVASSGVVSESPGGGLTGQDVTGFLDRVCEELGFPTDASNFSVCGVVLGCGCCEVVVSCVS